MPTIPSAENLQRALDILERYNYQAYRRSELASSSAVPGVWQYAVENLRDILFHDRSDVSAVATRLSQISTQLLVAKTEASETHNSIVNDPNYEWDFPGGIPPATVPLLVDAVIALMATS